MITINQKQGDLIINIDLNTEQRLFLNPESKQVYGIDVKEYNKREEDNQDKCIGTIPSGHDCDKVERWVVLLSGLLFDLINCYNGLNEEGIGRWHNDVEEIQNCITDIIKFDLMNMSY